MNRKYEDVKGYWVYSIQVPSINKYYVGVSKQQCNRRWCKSKYKDTVLKDYLNEWDSMVKTVLVDNLTKEEAYKYEDNIIRALQMNDLCINKLRSGLFRTNDKNEYHKQLYQNNTEYRERTKQRSKQHYQNDVEYREREKQRKKQQRLKKKQNQTSLL